MIGPDNETRPPDVRPQHPGPGHFSARQCGKCGKRAMFSKGWKKHPAYGFVCCMGDKHVKR